MGIELPIDKPLRLYNLMGRCILSPVIEPDSGRRGGGVNKGRYKARSVLHVDAQHLIFSLPFTFLFFVCLYNAAHCTYNQDYENSKFVVLLHLM